MTIQQSLVCLAFDASALTTQRPVEALASMTRSLDPEVALDPTIDPTDLLADIGTLSLDRGYDYPAALARLEDRGLSDSRSGCAGSSKLPILGGRTTASTDRRERRRHATLRLATAVLIIG